MEDDTETNLSVFQPGYSYEHKGWVIYRRVEGAKLIYHSGPWETSDEAQTAMTELNSQQGVEI